MAEVLCQDSFPDIDITNYKQMSENYNNLSSELRDQIHQSLVDYFNDLNLETVD